MKLIVVNSLVIFKIQVKSPKTVKMLMLKKLMKSASKSTVRIIWLELYCGGRKYVLRDYVMLVMDRI